MKIEYLEQLDENCSFFKRADITEVTSPFLKKENKGFFISFFFFPNKISRLCKIKQVSANHNKNKNKRLLLEHVAEPWECPP